MCSQQSKAGPQQIWPCCIVLAPLNHPYLATPHSAAHKWFGFLVMSVVQEVPSLFRHKRKPDETNCIFLLPFQTDYNSCSDDFQVGRAQSLAISPTKPCVFGVIRVGHACSLIFPQSCPGTSQGLVTMLRDRLNYLLLTDEDLEAQRDGVSYVPKATHSQDSNPCVFQCPRLSIMPTLDSFSNWEDQENRVVSSISSRPTLFVRY